MEEFKAGLLLTIINQILLWANVILYELGFFYVPLVLILLLMIINYFTILSILKNEKRKLWLFYLIVGVIFPTLTLLNYYLIIPKIEIHNLIYNLPHKKYLVKNLKPLLNISKQEFLYIDMILKSLNINNIELNIRTLLISGIYFCLLPLLNLLGKKFIKIIPEKLFDTSVHYDSKYFDNDREQVLNTLTSIKMINIGEDFNTSIKSIELANKYNNIYATLALHPKYISITNYDVMKLKELKNEKVVAIGTTGLDTRIDNYERQKIYLLSHIKLANELKLPLIVYSYEKFEDIYEILKHNPVKRGGIIKDFNSDISIARSLIISGFYFSFSGIITYDNRYNNIIKKIPLKRILVSTDSPYLSPKDKQNMRNTSNNIRTVLDAISQIQRVPYEKVCEQVYENTIKVFNINE